MTRSEAFARLSRARAEYVAARFAIRHVAEALSADPDLLRSARENSVTEAELRRAKDHLEVTFALRLVSEFEAVLRDYWSTGLRRKTRPDMRPLIEAIGRRRGVGPDDLRAAHEVREFRNDVVHSGLLTARLNLAGHLTGSGRYLRWLPPRW